MVCILSGCTKRTIEKENSLSTKEKNTELEKSENSYVVTCIMSDLNHDGEKDYIYIDYLQLTYNSQGIGTIDVVDSKESFIWGDNYALVHSAWKEYYLVSIDNDDYLFLYEPDNSQGEHCEHYKLFYFDSDGNEIIKDEISLYEIEENYKQEKYEYFCKTSESYINEGVLLVSTWDGILSIIDE